MHFPKVKERNQKVNLNNSKIRATSNSINNQQ